MVKELVMEIFELCKKVAINILLLLLILLIASITCIPTIIVWYLAGGFWGLLVFMLNVLAVIYAVEA